MNRDGYWIDVEKHTQYKVDTHDRWISREENANLVNLPKHIFQIIQSLNLNNEQDVDKIRLLTVYHCEIVRMRAHDTQYVFEFAKKENRKYIDEIKRFLYNVIEPGPFTIITIINLQTKELLSYLYKDIEKTKDWVVLMKSSTIHYRSNNVQKFANNLFENLNFV